jgi:hypothetical protein
MLMLAAMVIINVVVVAPAPAEAYNCPTGWVSVTGGATINNVTMFCYWPNTGGGIGGDNIHFLKANVAAVGQYTRNPSNPSDLWNYRGSSSNPNPDFLKKSVRDHLVDYMPAGVKIVINGTFFNCTESCSNSSSLSFPTWRAGNALVNTGSNVSVSRRCIAFGNGYVPATFNWTNTSTTWSGVSAATGQCGSGTPYHRVVGLGPLVQVGNLDARTYIGYDLAPNPDQICFLVGGYMTNQAAVDVMSSMGCSGAVQLDGGNSSQLSYVNPSTGVVTSPVDGRVITHRKVPHYFVIFG